MIFGRKRREQASEAQLDTPAPADVRSLFNEGPSKFAPPESDGDGPAPASDSATRPRVVFGAVRSGPDGFTSHLPIHGELAGVIPGPDRPDYCLVVLDEPIDFDPPADFDRERIRQSGIDQLVRDIEDTLPISTLVVAARQTGTQISPTMVDLWVNVAYVLDESVLTDEVLEFDKVHFAAIASLNLA